MDLDYPYGRTLRFVEMAEQVKASGLSIEDLNYLLRHHFDETGKYRPNQEKTLTRIKNMAEGIRAIRLEHAVQESPGSIKREDLKQKLGLILSPEVVDTLFAMIEGNR